MLGVMSKLTMGMPKPATCCTFDTVMKGELTLTPFDATTPRLSPPTSIVMVGPGTTGTATFES